MQRTKIEWTDYTWNPIKGLCPVGCWYCYGRAMYKRFKWNPEITWDGRVPILSNKKPSKIFVCSTIELFHPAIPKEYRDRIFRIIEADFNQKHTFQILTKMPENIDRPMPDNVWLGVSITGMGDRERMAHLHGINAKIKFISWEPLLANPLPPGWSIPRCVNWAIVGRLTGHGKKHDPNKSEILSVIFEAKLWGIPIFLKNNLKEIWGEKLIQEFPL